MVSSRSEPHPSGGKATSNDEQALEVARLCHDLAIVLESAAGLLHERAATFLASVASRGPHDRQRIEWGVALAAAIEAKGAHDDAERVLVAALALSEGLFGRDDPQSVAARKRLTELRATG